MGRIPLKIGNSVELSVGVYVHFQYLSTIGYQTASVIGPFSLPSTNSYSLCRRTSAPTSVKIHRDTNSEVKTQTRVYNKETGDDVMPQDIKLFQSYGGKKLCLGTEEVNKMKQLGISGNSATAVSRIKSVTYLFCHTCNPSHI